MARELIGPTDDVAKAPEVPKPVPLQRGRVAMLHPQQFYAEDAHDLAEALGWRGADSDVLRGVSCRDAKRKLTKFRHQLHISVFNGTHSRVRTPEQGKGSSLQYKTPTAEMVCEALNIENAERQKAVADWLGQCELVDMKEAEDYVR